MDQIDILSLDVSSRSTGWAHIVRKNYASGKVSVVVSGMGCIAPSHSNVHERLASFEHSLMVKLFEIKPDVCVIEDLNHTRNINIVKVLSSFLGVAQKCCYLFNKNEPIMIRRKDALKTVLGRGNAEKEDAILYAQQYFGPQVDLDVYGQGIDDVADALITGFAYIKKEYGGIDGKA